MDKYSVVINRLFNGERKEDVVRKHLTLMGAQRVRNSIHKKDPTCAVSIKKEGSL